jgi:integrase
MTVTLRERLKGNKISLYLDYYQNGKRTYEYLKLYLHPEPEKGRLTKQQKKENDETRQLAVAIKAKRQVSIQNNEFGFKDKAKLSGNFIDYMQMLTDKRRGSKGNYGNWDSTMNHLKNYSPLGITFGGVNKEWLEGFKDYLQSIVATKKEVGLSRNSMLSYFNKVKAGLKQAVKDGIIQTNPGAQVDSFKEEETQREFLSLEELNALYNTPCGNGLLKRAFIFSALTGLRWSDIKKLVWSEIQHSTEMGYFIRFRQKKTQGTETLPISEEAYRLLGDPASKQEQIFRDLSYSAWNNIRLREWAMAAGINRHIVFHAARHTHAVLLLSSGTDIYTVSKMLGHREIKTTQRYMHVIDKKKIEAANTIHLKLNAKKDGAK